MNKETVKDAVLKERLRDIHLADPRIVEGKDRVLRENNDIGDNIKAFALFDPREYGEDGLEIPYEDRLSENRPNHLYYSEPHSHNVYRHSEEPPTSALEKELELHSSLRYGPDALREMPQIQPDPLDEKPSQVIVLSKDNAADGYDPSVPYRRSRTAFHVLIFLLILSAVVLAAFGYYHYRQGMSVRTIESTIQSPSGSESITDRISHFLTTVFLRQSDVEAPSEETSSETETVSSETEASPARKRDRQKESGRTEESAESPEVQAEAQTEKETSSDLSAGGYIKSAADIIGSTYNRSTEADSTEPDAPDESEASTEKETPGTTETEAVLPDAANGGEAEDADGVSRIWQSYETADQLAVINPTGAAAGISDPSTGESSSVVLPSRALVTVGETNGDYTEVSYMGYSTWVPGSSLLAVNAQDVLSAMTRTAYITADSAVLRDGPSADASGLAQLSYGTEEQVLDVKDGWTQVSVQDQTGWVEWKDITLYLPGKYYAAVAAGRHLNIRSDASADASVVASADSNEQFEIREFKNGWGKVEKGSATGWASLQYLVPVSGS